MRNKLLCFFLALSLVAVLPVKAATQEFDPDARGSLSVSLVSKEGNTPMAGAELSVYQVATVGRDQQGKLFYGYTGAFAQCGISLDDPELAEKLDAFLGDNPVECRKLVTDSQGYAVCQDLPLGLYLIRQTGEAEGFAPCAPFLVTVPMETEGGYVYHVDASPKTEVAKLVDITLRKVWNADKSEAIPVSVTVQLFRQEELVATAVLSEENQWQMTYEDLPESDGYRIVELEVPQGFAATYSREGYVFTVTNTSSLAQTGQLVWPIPVFAMAGLVLMMLGVVILRKPGKRDA